MDALNLNKAKLGSLGLCLGNDCTTRERLQSLLRNVQILSSYLVIIYASASYIWANLDDIGSSVYALMQIVGYVEIGGSYATLMAQKVEVFVLFETLEQFVKERQCPQRNVIENFNLFCFFRSRNPRESRKCRSISKG